MAEMFSGDWVLEAFENGPGQRFVIEGSLASDGRYAANSLPISVSGPRWFFRFERLFNAEIHTQRRSGAYTLQGGLVVYLGYQRPAFTNIATVLRCRNLDPKLNPWYPFTNPYDFTLPRQKRTRPGRPPTR